MRMQSIPFLMICMSISSFSFAQTISVTYSEKRDLSANLPDGNQDPQVAAILASLSNDESIYKLLSSKGESIYSKQSSSMGGETGAMVMNLSGSNYQMYRNKNKNETIEQNSILNKPFIIKEDLKPLDWKITTEEKVINDLVVKKATCLKNGKEVVAWFTQKFSINEGPREFWGLPGLIVMVEYKDKTILANSIEILDSVESIRKPKEGKVVTRQEYEELKDEKENSLLSGYGGGKTIRIQRGK